MNLKSWNRTIHTITAALFLAGLALPAAAAEQGMPQPESIYRQTPGGYFLGRNVANLTCIALPDAPYPNLQLATFNMQQSLLTTDY